MPFRVGQANFSRGVISPLLHGRFDVDAYASGLKQADNVIVQKYGGITKRPGTRLVAEVIDDGEPTRILPFQFSLEQTYILEMGQGYMAPIALGGRILEEELEITAISNATYAQVTADYHSYSVGDRVFLTGIAGEMGEKLNNMAWPVYSIIDTNNFTIDVDTTGIDSFTSADGGITRVSSPTPPPPPPPVPPPPPPPPAPIIGGGGGGGFGGYLDYLELY